MKELILVPFQKGLLYDFVYDGVENDLSGKDIKDMAEYYANMGHSFIAYIEGKAIGVGGVFPLWKDWGSAWLFLNQDAKKYKVSVFKAIVSKLHELTRVYNIQILTIQCLDQSMEAHRLLNHLGFHKSREVKMAVYWRKI